MAPGVQFGERHSLKRRAESEPEGEQRLATQFKRLRINNAPIRPLATSLPPPSSPPEYMPVDETKDRIVIHDLEAEIAQVEAEEPETMLLPDIDKKFSAIPQMLLKNRGEDHNTQLVLYQVPSSISVPENQDHVRKAIIAARNRVREKQAQEFEHAQTEDSLAMDHEKMEQNDPAPVMDDQDAMDIY